MDSKVKIFFLLLVSPILLFAQNKATKKYIDSSELQLKLFASAMFYSEQINIADTNANTKTVDYFGSKYFQESNYSQEAIDTILAYSKQEAYKDFYTEERGKCLCYTSSLLFFTSDKLNRKVKSLRKYLGKQAP
jgi:hypothetical protein